jgi:hypothetical protein
MNSVINLVDAGAFDRLFIQQLGWSSPTQKPLNVIDQYENSYTVSQVANYRGMGIWTCPVIPDLNAQRLIDSAVAAKTLERLIIYTDGVHQEWRWPRSTARKRSGPPTLVSHRHTVGQPNSALLERLDLISVPMGSEITVPELLDKMREAFDREAETASKQAARLMGGLYEKLDVAGMGERESSVFLARMLFLMFGDDTAMWKRNLFHDFLAEDTALDGSDLREKLLEAFAAADTPVKQRPSELSDGLRDLPYINGGIFTDDLRMPDLDAEFRRALLETCRFNWGQISPAVFGSMFQTVKTKEARRHLGEHYTTEGNILKTIEPLFLDELRERLEAAWDDRKALTKLHNDLGQMRFLDPACGCGNFLIVAYRELRALELSLMIRVRDLAAAAGDQKALQLAVDATHGLKVSIDQFYGIEIEAWPARIAETAMFLVDHQANLRMDHELGTAPTRLPLEVSPHIVNADALSTDWHSLVTSSNSTLIFGNPPFLGQYTKTKEQTALTKQVWGTYYNGYLDFVTCWYKKAVDYYGKSPGRWAFVSTNSISQGEAVAPLWKVILGAGWRCRFAHRSFAWNSEAAGKAAVHVSIIGFDRETSPEPHLWEYPEGGKGSASLFVVPNINPYLVDYKNVLVEPATRPLSSSLPAVTYGNKPTDHQYLIVSSEELESVSQDPIASKYLRRYVGARELLHSVERWCLWLDDSALADVRRSSILSQRVQAVAKFREKSTDPQTRRAADWPHRFQEVRQLDVPYLAIPAHVSEHRNYLTAAYLEPEVICSNANFMAPDPDGYLLGVLSSAMFMTWQRTIGGRLESRIRFSNTFSYNTFPWPNLSDEQRNDVATAGRRILAVRNSLVGLSLAQMYDQAAIPQDLEQAHIELDAVVDAIFELENDAELSKRQARLFTLYELSIAPNAADSLFC